MGRKRTKFNNPRAYRSKNAQDGTDKIYVQRFNEATGTYKEYATYNDPVAFDLLFAMLDLGSVAEVKISNERGIYILPTHGKKTVRRMVYGEMLKGHRSSPRTLRNKYRRIQKRKLYTKYLTLKAMPSLVYTPEKYKRD